MRTSQLTVQFLSESQSLITDEPAGLAKRTSKFMLPTYVVSVLGTP